MSLFPKEHGAYGQITLPLITRHCRNRRRDYLLNTPFLESSDDHEATVRVERDIPRPAGNAAL